jgi:uncharacterized protein
VTKGPLTVGLLDLLRRPGSTRELRAEAAIDDLVLEDLEVRAGPTVQVALRLESLSDGIVVSGTASSSWTGSCRRCLEPVAGEVVADVREVFSNEVGRGAEDGDARPIDGGDLLDLTDTVREAVLLALPLAPLCSEECAGPAPDRFPAAPAALGEEESASEGRDPRWAALDALRPELE